MKDLGSLMVQKDLIDSEQLEAARKAVKKNDGESLAKALVRLGYVEDSQLTQFLAEQYGVPAIDLENFEIEDDLVELMPRDICLKHMVFPVSKAGNTLVVAFADPSNIFVKDDLQFLTRHKVEVMVASEVAILRAIEKYYDRAKQNEYDNVISEIEDDQDVEGQKTVDIHQIDDETNSAVIKFVNMTLAEAIKLGVSDIHVEPYEKSLRVRFRKDGKLIEKVQPPKGIKDVLASRIKIMANMDIAERRKPQDGRIRIKTNQGVYVDFRVNCLPTIHGEKIVMRILDKSNLKLDLRDLGFEEDNLKIFLESIHRPQGMVLVTGPTGSGKTTTLYSSLQELNNPEKNISTAEDPVEFSIDGVNQVQINPKIEFGFAHALRAFLRQDPDIVLVGEIRDRETAEVAFKAASTGHLVMSTLHTNDAPSTVVRLLDMDVPTYLITSSISIVLAQRLISKLCGNCKKPFRIDNQVLLDLGAKQEELDQYEVYKPDGCKSCNETGYVGRMAIYELMTMTDELRESIIKGATPVGLKRAAVESGMRTLRMAALEKLKKGETSVEQVLSTTLKDELE